MIDLRLGDCLELMPSIPDGSVDAVITDPPYGIAYQSAWRSDKAERHPRLVGDAQPFVWFLPEAYRVLKDGGALLCFCRWDTQEAFRLAITWAGFKVRQHVIWDRDWHGMADVRTLFAPQHDIIWQASKGRCELRGVRPKSVIRVGRISAEQLEHPTEKPVALMKHLIGAVSDRGGTILDCFMGTGAVGVACQELDRSFIGIEIDNGYFAAAETRIHAAASQQHMDFSREKVITP